MSKIMIHIDGINERAFYPWIIYGIADGNFGVFLSAFRDIREPMIGDNFAKYLTLYTNGLLSPIFSES